MLTIFVVRSSPFCAPMAGHMGDYYQNCDDGHTMLNVSNYPDLGFIDGPRGSAKVTQFDKVVIGNASLAYNTGSYGQMTSMNRHDFMNSQYQVNRAYDQYVNNNHYWYPEHRDHDARDMYHAMTPYVSNSQGSSGSEMDEVRKYVLTLAAFTPEVKEKLKEEKLIAPMVEMIFRRTRVSSDEEYLSGIAHPNAFDNVGNQDDMIAMANAITLSDIPPMVQLNTIEDSYDSINKIDFFETFEQERLFDTPQSIARIYRGREQTKYIVVNATGSYDVNGRPLTYEWVVLRGDPEHVRINKLDAAGTRAEIQIDYHPETVIENTTILTSLVVVGVFVNNGVYYSAPAFITSYTIYNEDRVYNSDSLLAEITYTDEYKFIPISTPKGWEKDVFHYDVNKLLTGWTRFDGGIETEYTAEGYLVTETDGSGNVTRAQDVTYQRNLNILEPNPNFGWIHEPYYRYNSIVAQKNQSSQVDLKNFISNLSPTNVSFSQITNPANGEITLNPMTGELIYRPDDNYHGWDSFACKVIDNLNTSVYIVKLKVFIEDNNSDPDPDPNPDPDPDPDPDQNLEPYPDPNPNPDPDPDPEIDLIENNQIPETTVLKVKNNLIKSKSGKPAIIECELNKEGNLKVKIYNTNGQEIMSLYDGYHAAGTFKKDWYGTNSNNETVGSGLYFAYMQMEGYSKVKKIVVIK